MELYRKKINLDNKVNKRLRDKYIDSEYSQPRTNNKNIIFQKMLKKKNLSRPKNDALNMSSEHIQNVCSSVEDILSNEKKKKSAIKYVIQIGKNKRIPNTSTSYDLEPNYERSESPRRNRGYGKGYINSFKNSPMKNQDEQNPGMNKYISISDYTNIDLNNPKRNYQTLKNDTSKSLLNQPNYINTEESQNDFDLSSINDEERGGGNYGRNPDSRIMNRINRVLKERYEKAERKTNERRNRNIPAMQRIRKHSNNPSNFNYRNNNNDDDVDELIKTIEELQAANKNLKRDNYNKNKEINMLKNDLDNMQKELDEKRMERDKEIEDIFKENNDPKLKNEYYKILQDYDNNINDFNNLKDDYNQIVDEYNSLKTEKNRLFNDNKNLKNNLVRLEMDYNNMKNEANKAIDDYNNIVEDFNKLDQENKKLKEDFDKIKDNEYQPGEIKDEDFNKLNNDYNKLNDDYNKLNDDYNKLKEENDNIKKEMEEMSQVPRDEDYERLYEGYNKLEKDNE